MKHQAKQALAWIVAVGASSAVYGGGAWWMKRLASRAGHEATSGHSSQEHASEHDAGQKPQEHESKEHEPNQQGTKDHEKKEHVSDSGAHQKLEHKEAEHHQAAATEHQTAEHQTAEQGHAGHQGAKEEGDHRSAPATSDQKSASEHKSAGPHWSYKKSAADGPSHWGDIADSFEQCEKGREQSPIDLKQAVTRASAPKIIWHYNPVAVNVENNGHTVVATMPNSQNHVTIDGETYNLAQFHFHNPSEHKIGGIPSDMELHFVHKNRKGELAVIGVMLNEKSGVENAFLKPLWQTLPREAHSKAEATPTINLAKLLPLHRDYFHYAGSLTTPPCSQGVRWFVLKEPVTISGSQADLYAGLFDGPTNRPVQPLFGREVIQSVGPAAVAH